MIPKGVGLGLGSLLVDSICCKVGDESSTLF